MNTVIRNDQLESLVAGYRNYASPEEMTFQAASDEPATSPFCGFFASFAFSYITTNGPG